MTVAAGERSPDPPDPPDEQPPDARSREGRPPYAAPLVLVALLLFLVLRFSALHLGNSDTWFHLVLGDRFRDGWSLAHPGGLTRFATSDWVATQWSTEVLASQVESWFGLPGVAWLFGAMFLLLVLGTYVSCRRFGRPVAVAVVTALLVFGCAPVLSARPQIVSLVLLTVTVAAWLRTAEDGRARWWLVPMTWVWATAHGLWSAGVLLGLVCWVGLLLDRRATGRRALALLAVPLLSLAATLVTPVGPALLSSQLAVSARTSLIREWGPTDFRTVPALAVALMIAWVVVLWARHGGVTWTRLLLLLLAGGWALLVTRTVSLAAVVVAPLLVEALERSLAGARTPERPEQPAQPESPAESRTRPPTMARGERVGLGVLAVAYLVALAVAAPQAADAPADVPEALAPLLVALPAGSAVLVEDGLGGWVEWRAPGVEPVIDGLLDAYPVAYIRDFFTMTAVEPGWEGFVERTGARDAVLQADSALTLALRERLHWRVVGRDGDYAYLVAPGGGAGPGAASP